MDYFGRSCAHLVAHTISLLSLNVTMTRRYFWRCNYCDFKSRIYDSEEDARLRRVDHYCEVVTQAPQ